MFGKNKNKNKNNHNNSNTTVQNRNGVDKNRNTGGYTVSKNVFSVNNPNVNRNTTHISHSTTRTSTSNTSHSAFNSKGNTNRGGTNRANTNRGSTSGGYSRAKTSPYNVSQPIFGNTGNNDYSGHSKNTNNTTANNNRNYSNSTKKHSHIPTFKMDSRNAKALPIYIFVFALVVVQVLGYSFSRLTKNKVNYDTVQYGTIESPNVIQGVIIRDEKVYNTTVAGVISYDVADGDKVKANTEVCSIKDQQSTAEMEKNLEKIDNDIMDVQEKRDDISIYSDDITKDNQQIKDIMDDSAMDFAKMEVQNVYELRASVEKELTDRNNLLLSENKGALTDLVTQRQAQEDKLNQSISKITSAEGGVVSYSVIGDESKYTAATMKSLTKKQTLVTENSENTFKNSVKANTPVFKVVTSNTWHIAAYIKTELMKDWKAGNMINIYTKDSEGIDYTLPVTINSILDADNDKEKYVVFDVTKNMFEFVADRSISFETQKSKKGYKVPNSSIVDETLLQIPSDYITEDLTVNKVNGNTTTPIQVVVSSTNTEKKISLVPVQLGKLNVGDILQKPNGTDKFTIADVVNSNGIYVVNSGIAEFKTVNMNDSTSNSTHTILDVTSNPNINIYDRIITDTENVKKEDKVFE